MVPAPQGSIILDLDIAGFAGDTKAVKNDWANGDKLNLWFDDWNYTAQADNPTPDLVITYDGTKWTAGELAAGRSLKSSGKFSVVYEGFNNLTKYDSKFESGGQMYMAPSDLISGTIVRQNNIVYYTYYLDYTYADNKLTATISDWETYSGVKILVKGLNHAEAANYGLCAKNTTAGKYLDEIAGFSIDPKNSSSGYYPHVYSLIGSYSGYVLGVPDTDGVAFYYRMPTLPMLISSSGFSRRTQAETLNKPPRRRSLPERRSRRMAGRFSVSLSTRASSSSSLR